MHEPRLKGKSHVISKRLVWDAWLKVKDNGGAAGVDGVTIEQFEEDLSGNLYALWNRMSSGSYFPGPVRAVEIPKQGGIRVLGIPNVVDRVAQTAAAMALEPNVEPMFHEDSYAYRPGRAPVDAVAVCRERCFRKDWVVDLDIRAFFDSVPWALMLRAVVRHSDQKWVVMYVERWLKAPMQRPDGTLVARVKGTPQGALCSAAHKEPNEQRWVMRSAARDPDGCRGWPVSTQHNPAADGCSALDVTAMKSPKCVVPPTHALVGQSDAYAACLCYLMSAPAASVTAPTLGRSPAEHSAQAAERSELC